jgi:hypothetical protein
VYETEGERELTLSVTANTTRFVVIALPTTPLPSCFPIAPSELINGKAELDN